MGTWLIFDWELGLFLFGNLAGFYLGILPIVMPLNSDIFNPGAGTAYFTPLSAPEFDDF
ncbi:MAG: hypothetical protein IKP62_12760 [Salinivirgaceae bacterium]|nr:hypothetical protein [Salinivirgaceae bacterium]